MQPTPALDASRMLLVCRTMKSIRHTSLRAGWYRFVFVTLKIVLIILAALVAASKKEAYLATELTYMSAAIMILTAVDGFLQASTKWKINFRYNDKYDSAFSELGMVPDDALQLDAFRKKLDAIDSAYAKETLV